MKTLCCSQRLIEVSIQKIFFALFTFLFISLVSGQGLSDKYYRFIGNYPNDATPSWGDAVWATGSLAHDNKNLFIGATRRDKSTGKTNNKNWAIWRWPAIQDLNQDLDNGDKGVITFNLENSTTTSTTFRKYGHIGDMDCFKYGGEYYLAIPLTSKEKGYLPIVAFFRARDLKYINFAYVDKRYQTDIGWCAVHPITKDLYTSRDRADSILVYAITWSKVFDKKSHDALAIKRKEFHKISTLHNMQGGEFTEDGKLLYVSCGLFDCFGSSSTRSYPSDGIHVFETGTWTKIQRSTNPERKEDGCFNFWFDNQDFLNQCYQEEPEGLTIWDMDKVPNHHPGLKGQLHVLVDDHNPYIPWTSSSTLSIRHFKRSRASNDEWSTAKGLSPCDETVTNNYYATPSRYIPAIPGYHKPIEDVWYEIHPVPLSSFSVETYQVPGGLTNTVMQLFNRINGHMKELASDQNSGFMSHSKVTVLNYAGSGPVYIRITDYEGNNYGKFGIYYKNIVRGTPLFTGKNFYTGESEGLYKSTKRFTGDVNGDGKTDFIFAHYDGTRGIIIKTKMSHGDGTYTAYQQTLANTTSYTHYFGYAVTGDVNGDGKTDLIFPHYTSSTGLSIRTSISNGDGTYNTYRSIQGDGEDLLNYGLNTVDFGPLTGDINGDGKTDLIFAYQSPTKGLTIRTKISNGDGSYRATSSIQGEGKSVSTHGTLAGDVDGDGKTDLVFTYNNVRDGLTILTKISKGDGTFTSFLNIQGDGGLLFTNKVFIMDVNGDGKMDLVFPYYKSGSGLIIVTKMSNGDGTYKSYEDRMGDGSGVFDNPTLAGDVNGDGKADLIFVGQDWKGCGLNIRVKHSNGDGTWCADFQGTGDGSGVHKYPTLTGDFDGNGKTDLAFLYFSGTEPVLNLRTKLSNDSSCMSSGKIIQLCANSGSTITSNITGSAYQWQVNTGNGFISIVDNNNFSGTNKITLQLNNIPSSWSGYKYQCIVNGSDSSNIFMTNVSAQANAGNDTAFCSGEGAQLHGTGGNTYLWSPTSGLSNPNIADPIASPDTTTQYTLTVFNNTCSSKDTVVITIDKMVTPSVSINSPNISCLGQPVTFTATPTNGGTSPVYQWVLDGINAGNSATYSSNALVTGDVINVLLTSNATCASPAPVKSNDIKITLSPTINSAIKIVGATAVTEGSSTAISSSITNGGAVPAYQWQDSTDSHSWLNISGAWGSTINYTPASNGDRIRCVLNSSGICITAITTTSNVLVFTVNPIFENKQIQHYPSPVTSQMNVDNLKISDEWETFSVTSIGGNQNIIFQNISGQTKVTIDVEMLSNGMYIATLRNKQGKSAYFKFMKL